MSIGGASICVRKLICFVDREEFFQSLENLSPSKSGFYNLFHLFLQDLFFA